METTTQTSSTNQAKQVIPSTDQDTLASNNMIIEKDIVVTVAHQPYEITLRIDFTEATKAELLTWAMSNRVISTQRALSKCTAETLLDFHNSGYEVDAKTCGVKPMTEAERKAELANGINKLSDEDKLAMLEMLQAQVGGE